MAHAGKARPVIGVVDLVIGVLALLAVLAAWCSIEASPSWSWGVIFGVNLYLLIVLTLAGYRSYDRQVANKHPWIVALFPSRVVGLYVMFGLIAATVLAFAGLYTDSASVFGRSLTRWEAIYISFSTLGFNDFAPQNDYGRQVVIVHLASTLLLIMGVFALLISRLSTFETPDSTEAVVIREAANKVLETSFGELVRKKEADIAKLTADLRTAQGAITQLQNAAAPKAAPVDGAPAAPKAGG